MKKELESRIFHLETKVKHLTNDLWITREENETATASYLEIHSNMEKIIDDRTKELTRTAEELRESEKKYRTILESIEEGYFELDIAGNFTFFNDAMCRSLGYPKNELMGMNNRAYMAQETARKVYQVFNRVHTTGVSEKGLQYELVRKDETKVYVETSVSLMEDAEGQPIGFRGILRDVSERYRAGEALRDSEQRYRQIIEGATDVIYIADYQGYCTYVNVPGQKLTGYPMDELVGMQFTELIPVDWRERVQLFYIKQFQDRENETRMEFPIITKTGEEKWVDQIVTILAEEDRITGFQSIVRNITDRKQAELELRESEEKYRTILESIEDGYFEVDLPGNLTFFNDALCNITGFSMGEIMGINNREYMDEETAKKVYATYVGIYETGEPVKGFEYEIQRDGKEKHVETSVSLRKDSEGQPIGFRGILRDVTERKRMEAELIQTKEFLQNILDSSIDGITSTDLAGNVLYSSSRASDIIGYESEELAGKKVSPHYENGVEDAKKIMKKLKKKGELRDYEMRFRKKDGGLIDINLSGSYLKNEKGEIIGTLGIYRDISDKKLLEAQLQQAHKMESIGTLAGGIAHNFNNLLMGIQGNASIMLLDIDSSNPRHKNLKNIEKLVENGAKLTAQLIGYAREGKYEVNFISLNQLVKETSDTFGMTKKEITVHQKLSEKLYGIKADQGQIEQVLLNLYVNAADAMPGGGDLFLKTMNVAGKDITGKPYEVNPGNYVLLTVRDTGVGMDKETKERIFEPFFTTKGLASGTGLGLASAYGIIKGHGGYIDVDSKVGEGTTFNIFLPATEKVIKEKRVLPDKLVAGKGTVLLVDDEEMVLEAGEVLLNHLGYEVLLAENGQEALDLYKKHRDKIDLVLLDMVMPVMGGGEAFDRIKEINTNVKVLLSSGYSLEGEAKEILKRGCDAFIQKPFKMEQLSHKIQELLHKR